MIKPVPRNIEFYANHYDFAFQKILLPEDKLFLGNKENRVCRFCRLAEPNVTFKKRAHALPESIGNKSIFSFYECDVCNEFFGQTIENDFANWSLPYRSIMRIRGKSGIPKMKREGDKGWRIETKDDVLKLSHHSDHPYFELNPDENTLTVPMARQAYQPIAVFKAFVKMGLSLLDDKEVEYFDYALKWVLDPDHKKVFMQECPLFYRFNPGPLPSHRIKTLLLKRREPLALLPYMLFVVNYGNDTFMVQLPSDVKDRHLNGKTVRLYNVPDVNPEYSEKYGQSGTAIYPMEGVDIIKDDVIPIKMHAIFED